MTERQYESLRQHAEAKARERHPEATRVVANVHHTDGPVVEVFKGREMLGLYRFVGWEL